MKSFLIGPLDEDTYAALELIAHGEGLSLVQYFQLVARGIVEAKPVLCDRCGVDLRKVKLSRWWTHRKKLCVSAAELRELVRQDDLAVKEVQP